MPTWYMPTPAPLTCLFLVGMTRSSTCEGRTQLLGLLPGEPRFQTIVPSKYEIIATCY